MTKEETEVKKTKLYARRAGVLAADESGSCEALHVHEPRGLAWPPVREAPAWRARCEPGALAACARAHACSEIRACSRGARAA